MSKSTLDKYDYLVIRNCKSQKGPNINIINRIFAKRCALSLEYVERKYVLDYLIDLVEYLELTSMSKFIDRLIDTKSYAYYHEADKHGDNIARCVNICCAEIRLCNVVGIEKLKDYPAPLIFRLTVKK